MSMTPALLLHPESGTEIPASLLAQLVVELGLGAAPAGPDWLPGPRFFDHLCFLGCSPTVDLHGGAQGCRIALLPMTPQPRWIVSAGHPTARCPACRTVHARRGVPDGVPTWTCTRCGGSAPADRWDWRRSTAHCRQGIVIAPVFEGEAAPDEGLLASLGSATSVRWTWAYVQLPASPASGSGGVVSST